MTNDIGNGTRRSNNSYIGYPLDYLIYHTFLVFKNSLVSLIPYGIDTFSHNHLKQLSLCSLPFFIFYTPVYKLYPIPWPVVASTSLCQNSFPYFFCILTLQEHMIQAFLSIFTHYTGCIMNHSPSS